MDSRTDAELVALSQQGDLEAFNQLVRKWDAGLYQFVRRMLGNAEDARDICQEALLRAHLNICRLRDPDRFRAWLHQIAVNLCRDWQRSARARPQPESLDEAHPEALRATGAQERRADRDLEQAELSSVLCKVLAQLSVEQRTAILLREYEGFTSEEIAQITGVPAATVRTRIFYGLKSVRKMLGGYGITAVQHREGAGEP